MDERSDVFGLGALLYEIVSGHTPYGKAKSAKEILAKAVAGQVVPLEAVTFGMDVSKRLRAIVARAVAPEPAQRFQSVLELQDDVRRFLRGGLYLPSQIFMPGTVIVREGDVGDTAYMIVSGRCRAFRDLPDGDETLAIMEAGDVFGEMALLLDEPRAASVEAVDQVTVLVLRVDEADRRIDFKLIAGGSIGRPRRRTSTRPRLERPTRERRTSRRRR